MTSFEPYTGDWSPEAFAGEVFVNVDFSHRALAGADFSNSLCQNCNFSDSDLSLANFTNADVYQSNFDRAVLYVTNLSNANMTRASFVGSYSYGWLPDASTNITYARVLQFGIETRRRSGIVVSGDVPPNVKDVPFGSAIKDTAQLCREDYQTGRHRFKFTDQDRRERAMQRSQVFNRLKRMYRENQSGEPALHCLYYERYYLTRSFYRYSPLADGQRRLGRFGALMRTVVAFGAEVTSGYGLKPFRVLRSLAALLVLFIALAGLAGEASAGAGVAYSPTGVVGTADGCAPACDFSDLQVLAFYGIKSMISADPEGFVVFGWMGPVALVYFVVSLAFFAMLFSSLFLRLLNE